MKKILWIIGIVFALGIIALVIILMQSSPAQTQVPSGTVSLPTAGSITPTRTSNGSGTTVPNKMSLSIVGGGTIVTNDFIHNGETVVDVENPGSYQLAGSLGYCLANGTCPSGSATTDFSVSYSETTQSFNIVLLKEPLGAVRNTAEQFLGSRLGITANDLCRLNYYIGTSYQINSFYSGKNLGFSFCPGATVLPK